MMDGVTRGINTSLPQWEVMMCHLVLSQAGAYKRNGKTGVLVRNISKLWPSPRCCQLHRGSHVSNREIVRSGLEEAHFQFPYFRILCFGILKQELHWNEYIFTIVLVCKDTSPWNLSCVSLIQITGLPVILQRPHISSYRHVAWPSNATPTTPHREQSWEKGKPKLSRVNFHS